MATARKKRADTSPPVSTQSTPDIHTDMLVDMMDDLRELVGFVASFI